MWQDRAAIESNGYVKRAVGLVEINQSGRGRLRATLGEAMSGGSMGKVKKLASPNLNPKSRERAQARYEHWNNLYLEAQK